MVKMTKNSAMGGLLEPIKNSAIWKSVLREAVLRKAWVYLFLSCAAEALAQSSGSYRFCLKLGNLEAVVAIHKGPR